MFLENSWQIILLTASTITVAVFVIFLFGLRLKLDWTIPAWIFFYLSVIARLWRVHFDASFLKPTSTFSFLHDSFYLLLVNYMRLGFPRIETGIIYFTPHFFFYSLLKITLGKRSSRLFAWNTYCDVVVHFYFLVFFFI